jgi:hypothetical protein
MYIIKLMEIKAKEKVENPEQYPDLDSTLL